ncbi:MAG: hypothetical protein BWY81_00172 [Firmicutes bacterium ADurb.Bin467]|nr:MAG: hypothetical protein BWY81_00172 [Firmicutes bacterium ADurb.Bin467]
MLSTGSITDEEIENFRSPQNRFERLGDVNCTPESPDCPRASTNDDPRFAETPPTVRSSDAPEIDTVADCPDAIFWFVLPFM